MNVLIVEDETHTANLLREFIQENNAFLVVDVVDSIVGAVDYISRHQNNLDLLFFDIHLADGLSFEIFNHIDITTPIIFCTAYDDFTLKAIKNNGIDYILKPFKNEEVQLALEKYQKLRSKLIRNDEISFKPESPNYQRHFLCQYKESTIVIKIEDIAFFSIQHEITYLHSFNNKKYPLYKKLDHIESVCPKNDFFKINRQMIINKNAILSYEPYFNRKIILHLSVKTEENPVVSRLKVSSFKKWLERLT